MSDILIIGAGIGGLTAALALSRDGHRITLVEKSDAPYAAGAGIVLAPNAGSILAALGVDLSKSGHALAAMDIVDAHGKSIQRIVTGESTQQFGPTWALARPELQHLLLEAVHTGPFSSNITVQFGTSIHDSDGTLSLNDASDGITVTLDSQDRSATAKFDLVVAADGIHSGVRRAVHGDLPLLFSSVTCWRGIVEGGPCVSNALEAWGGASRVGLVPLTGGRVYYFLVRTAERRQPNLSWPQAFANEFGGFDGLAGEVLAHLHSTGVTPPLHHDLDELPGVYWGSGRVFLLGDAAHAMTPNQGQGAAMAIEDAMALSLSLHDGFAGARDRYQKRRQARVSGIQLDSRRLGRVAHWQSPLARGVRDGLMRLLPPSMMAAQYRSIVQPGLAMAQSLKAAATSAISSG